MKIEQRDCIVRFYEISQLKFRRNLKIKTKSFKISKHLVFEAYKSVKRNKGSAGVDGESIEEFEKNLKNNLYKLWNRMSSGSYFPSPVLLVEIPKKNGGVRPLGIPTVADRIAQTVVKRILEPVIEPHFHDDSYGYRPNKSALEAVGTTRYRCWQYEWAIDLDIKGFFDNLDHSLLIKALSRHTDYKWILLYVKRWLKAPMQNKGEIIPRDKGTPQGGVISPLLANLYLHYVMDMWLGRNYPNVVFERYADDAVLHCKTHSEAVKLLSALKLRLKECKLELNLQKTNIAFCNNRNVRNSYPISKFDFLGYTFRCRRCKNRRGKYFVGFTPAVSNAAKKAMRQEMRKWKIQKRSSKTLEDISHMFNPTFRGWLNYYSRYYPSELYCVFDHFNLTLTRWVMHKFKKFKRHKNRARHWLGKFARNNQDLFCFWKIGIMPPTGQ